MPFYIREAWLLDERKFTEWLDLFTDDVLYFMPRRKNVPRREAHRELTPLGNLEAAVLEGGEVEARTAFLVHRSHLETDHQLLSGCREDLLRNVNGAWKVARRTIVLDANVLLDKKLSVFL